MHKYERLWKTNEQPVFVFKDLTGIEKINVKFPIDDQGKRESDLRSVERRRFHHLYTDVCTYFTLQLLERT